MRYSQLAHKQSFSWITCKASQQLLRTQGDHCIQSLPDIETQLYIPSPSCSAIISFSHISSRLCTPSGSGGKGGGGDGGSGGGSGGGGDGLTGSGGGEGGGGGGLSRSESSCGIQVILQMMGTTGMSQPHATQQGVQEHLLRGNNTSRMVSLLMAAWGVT